MTNAKIADNAVTNSKIANDAVGSAKVINNSLSAADLGAGSVASSEVQDGSLGLVDVTSSSGFFPEDLPNLAAGACTVFTINTGQAILGGLTIVTPSFQLPNGLFVEGSRPLNGAAANIAVHVCNRSAAAIDAIQLPFFWGVMG